MTDSVQHDTTPHYDKVPFAPQWEYHHMTWEMFLILREWAQEVARQEGYPVYLVGSTLWKPYPRDLDVVIILPQVDFEQRFGPIPQDAEQCKDYLARTEYTRIGALYGMVLAERWMYAKRVDCKMQPDCWFLNRDRLLLATPDGCVRVRHWEMVSIHEKEDRNDGYRETDDE